ncbi:major capsid protein [Acinetobacter seifertii]|uniref:major capsid protein n=1 Tax=Acinetobacter seifertii TaxID=1530123 RepID=UPI0032B3B634
METQVQQTNKPSTLKRGLVVAATIGATVPAFAADAGFDVSSIVTIITGFVAGVSAIGLAVLSLVVTGKVFKWVRTAM